MNNYELRTNKKKLSIISTAKDLFREKGFVNVSIKEIASIANVSQVSIYNYFGNKDALVGECVNSLMSEVLDMGRELLNSEIDFKEKVSKVLSLCSNDLNKSLNKYFTQEALSDKALIKLIYEFVNKKKFELFSEYIEVGKNEGVIDKTISTETILRFIEAISIAESTVEYSNVPDSYPQEIQKLILYGVLGR